MNILLLLPPKQPSSGGNVTYSHRLKRGLAPRGIQIHIHMVDQISEREIAKADLVHVYNAYRTGRIVLPTLKRLRKPMILTITGTDINEYFFRPDSHAIMLEVLRYARNIVLLTETARQELINALPEAKDKAVVINLGVDLPQGVHKTRRDFGFGEDEFIFLLPAGIRPVKDPLAAVAPLQRLHAEFPHIRFALAGPCMDEELCAEVRRLSEANPWISYLGEVPHKVMPSLMQLADVVMNTSKSEGLSHALLEAMSLGKAVLASRVPGNTDLIQDDVNGLLFSHGEECSTKARRLILDQELRLRLGREAKRTVEKNYSLLRELNQFQQLYENAWQGENRICCED